MLITNPLTLTLSSPAILLLGIAPLMTPLIARAEEGRAVYYSDYYQGRRTASSEIFDQQGFTAAHKTLPLGTRVRLTNLTNNKSVIVKINDRMPRYNTNLVDVTTKVARELDFLRRGVAHVRLEILKDGVEEAEQDVPKPEVVK